MDGITEVFTQQFMPHGYCLRWFPGLLWTHVISDAVIALAYFSIPLSIIYVLRKRETKSELVSQLGWLGGMFALFILFCGITHTIEIVTIWKPYYGIEGLLKAATAVVSLITAAALIRLMPTLLSLQLPDQLQREIERRRQRERELEQINQQLRREFETRHRVQASKREIEESYHDLQEAMAQLQKAHIAEARKRAALNSNEKGSGGEPGKE